jgi:dolichyl-phosphate beta-glucosyltransferase
MQRSLVHRYVSGVAQPWMSVIVPAYNEERAIAGTLAALREWLDTRRRSYEIVVVDNASNDATAERVAPLLDGDRVRLLRNERNRGKGYSVRRGMLDATGELRLMCDADCTPSLPSLDRMVAMVESGPADVVAGSREAAGAEVERAQPLPRRIAGWNFLALCRLIMGEHVRDIFCGFKLFTAAAAQDAFSRQSLEGWTFDVEVLALARGTGHTVAECGIAWNDREGSRLQMHKVLVPVVIELLRARAHVRRALRPEASGVRTPMASRGPTPPEPLVPDAAERQP